jgi:uncharacterized membrane protein
MDPKLLVTVLVIFLHNLFTVVWMGGLIVSVISFLPALKRAYNGATPQVKKVMRQYQRRHSVWVYISMGGLLLTGMILSNFNPGYSRLFNFENTFSTVLSIKHILVLLMIVVTLYRSLVSGKIKGALTPQQENLNQVLMVGNAVLAVLVLLASAAVMAF